MSAIRSGSISPPRFVNIRGNDKTKQGRKLSNPTIRGKAAKYRVRDMSWLVRRSLMAAATIGAFFSKAFPTRRQIRGGTRRYGREVGEGGIG
jgi:hypothetical protein